MYIPLSDDKHQMVRDSSKKRTGQCGRNSNPFAALPHAAVVFYMQPFNYFFIVQNQVIQNNEKEKMLFPVL